MADREKVVGNLQILRTQCEVNHLYGMGLDSDDCEKAVGWLDDAIELLKAQEPRVLTLDELWHMEHKLVYLQCANSRHHIAEHAILLKAKWCYVQYLGESYIFMREHKVRDTYWACDYNVTWRCWSARPTDAEREAVK